MEPTEHKNQGLRRVLSFFDRPSADPELSEITGTVRAYLEGPNGELIPLDLSQRVIGTDPGVTVVEFLGRQLTAIQTTEEGTEHGRVHLYDPESVA